MGRAARVHMGLWSLRMLTCKRNIFYLEFSDHVKNDPGVIFFPWDQRRIIFFPWDQLSGFVNLYAPRLGRKSLAVRSISVPLGSHVLPWQTSRVIFHQWFLLGSFSSHNLNFLSNTFVFHDLFVQTTIISLSGRREHDSPIGSTSIKSLRLWPKKRHLRAVRREGMGWHGHPSKAIQI